MMDHGDGAPLKLWGQASRDSRAAREVRPEQKEKVKDSRDSVTPVGSTDTEPQNVKGARGEIKEVRKVVKGYSKGDREKGEPWERDYTLSETPDSFGTRGGVTARGAQKTGD